MAPNSILVATFTGRSRRKIPAATPSCRMDPMSSKYAETSWVLGKRGYRLADAAEPVANIFLKGVTRDGV